MAILQMQRFSICAMKKNRKAILEELQSLGVMEVNTANLEESGLNKMNTTEARQKFEKNSTLADHALEILDEYSPQKKSMFSSLAGKELVEKSKYEAVVSGQAELVKTANQLLSLKKKLSENKASIVKKETQIEALAPWMNLDVPLSFSGTEKVAVIIGSIGGEVTLDEIYQNLAKEDPELEAFDIQCISKDKDQICIAAVCIRSEAARLEEALRTTGFARPALSTRREPAAVKKELEQEIADLQGEIKQIEEKIISYAPKREELEILSDYYRMRAQKYEVLGDLPQSRETFVLSGYIPARQAQALKDHLTEKFDLVVDIEDLKEEEEPPILLKNNKVAGSVEGVLSSYGLPQISEFDPSSIMAVFYIFFFGLMLSDAAYGILVFAGCAIALKKFPRMEESMQKTLRMFMYCGLSTLFWGLMFGGFFGDAIAVVSRVFFGHEIVLKPLWFEPLSNPMKLLIFCMLFGVIHLFTGLGIKGYLCIRDKKYLDFFCDVVLWYCFLIGLILMLLPSQIFVSMSQMNIVFPAWANTLAKALTIIGALGLLLMSGRDNKNPALRLALGAYDIYNVTGWLSDVLSYSRLLALGLATGVIASVINKMGSMMGGGIIGAIVFIIVFIIGHIFNMAINLLGAYVHTNRLQFVEFFGKFYEGGGRPFQPFKSKTKYVDIKEETSL